MREIVVDTETTGLDPYQGHRLVEIGCIELLNRIPTGNTFHRYVNPERDMPAEAFAVHGLSADFLRDKPLFAEIAEELLAFLGTAPLVIHNALFDLAFINAELERVTRTQIGRERLVDTLMLARRKYPGGSNRLDDLCERYRIDNSRRTKHGALLDAELLAEVYVELIGARQAQLGLVNGALAAAGGSGESIVIAPRAQPLAPRLSAAEAMAHRAFIATLGEHAIWRDYAACRRMSRRAAKGRRIVYGRFAEPAGIPMLSSARRRRHLARLAGGHLLLIEPDEVDRIDQQRREPAVAHGRGDDFAREREQQPRTFDHHERMHAVLRHVLDPEHTGEHEIETEQHVAGGVGLALELELDFDIGIVERRGIDVDLDADLRLLLRFGVSERGAFGFSNEKSLMYWARTLSCGGLSCPWPPLVGLAMKRSPGFGE